MASLKHKKHQKLYVKESEYNEEDIISNLQKKILNTISSWCNYDCYWYDCGYCNEDCEEALYASLQPLVDQIQTLSSFITEDYLEKKHDNF